MQEVEELFFRCYRKVIKGVERDEAIMSEIYESALKIQRFTANLRRCAKTP